MTVQHGTHSCYARGCRRPICREAHRRYMVWRALDRERNGPLLVPNVGTKRRIRALGVVRWTRAEIGARIGCSETNVRKLCVSDRVHRDTAEKVAVLYAEIEHLAGQGNHLTELYARRGGGHAPADWDGLDMDDPDVWPETFETRTWSCQWYKHSRCGGVRQLVTELGSEPAPCGCSCHETEEN